MSRFLLAIAFLAAITSLARAQSPIQWQGNARAAIDRAAEQSMPLMFWLTDRKDILDDDDLRDAQEESFRDPAVVALAQKRFIPVRVARNNSRVMEEVAKLGLPTNQGQYIAIVTADGKLIRQINAVEVAEPEVLAKMLRDALHQYLDTLYTETLKPVITAPESPKQDVRRAVQTVWQLGIISADQDCIALLHRPDLTAPERRKLTSMLGAMATPACIDALLNLASGGDKDAIAALAQAEAGALDTLLKELPTEDKPTPRQLAAYNAACRIAREPVKPEKFWTDATPEKRRQAIESLRMRAEPVLEYWNENVGRLR